MTQLESFPTTEKIPPIVFSTFQNLESYEVKQNKHERNKQTNKHEYKTNKHSMMTHLFLFRIQESLQMIKQTQMQIMKVLFIYFLFVHVCLFIIYSCLF